jgi:multiple sugar transport system substrate-binding protein
MRGTDQTSGPKERGVVPDRPISQDLITRRELVKKGAKLAVVAAASSVFSPFDINVKAASQGPLSFWQFYAPSGAFRPGSQWFEDMVKTWNATHDTKIELRYVPVSEFISGSKLQTAFAAGQGPDIFLTNSGEFLRYFNGGILVDLGQYMDEQAKNDFYANSMETRMVNGKIFGLPMEVEPMAMYYSVKAFEAARLSEVDLPKTWDQFLETARKLTKGDQFGCLFETVPGVYQNFTWCPFMWQGGGEMVTKDGKASAFNSPATVAALKWWQDTIKQNVAPRNALGVGAADVVANLAGGYCGMQNAGIWGVSALRESASDFKYGVFPLPIPPNGQSKTITGGMTFAANAKGKNPEAAAKFCVWAIGSMSVDSIQRVVDWCIKAKSAVAPRKSALDKADALGGYASGAMKTFKDEIFPTGRSSPRIHPNVNKPISDAIQACQLSGDDPRWQAEQASRRIDEFLAGYAGAPLIGEFNQAEPFITGLHRYSQITR